MNVFFDFLRRILSNQNEKRIVELLLKEKKSSTENNEIPFTIFDVGCFRGNWTNDLLNILERKTKKKSKYHLFDVNPKSEIYLKELLKKNNIKFNFFALSDEKGEKDFYFNNFFEPSGSSLDTIYSGDELWVKSRQLFMQLFSFKKIKGFSKMKVRTDTLDNYCIENNIETIDILKMDVEGSEQKVFFGGQNILENVKIIYTEIVERKKLYDKKEQEIIDFLKEKNFIFIEKHNIKSVSMISNVIAQDCIFINKKYFD